MTALIDAAEPALTEEVVPEDTKRAARSRSLLALPSLLWWALFFLVPLGVLVVYSFGQLDIITFTMSWGWTLDNYPRIMETLYLDAILRSVLLALGATVGTFALGFPVAYFISRQRGRLQQILIVAILIPFWVSFVIRTYAWINVLDETGPLASFLRDVGLLHGSFGLAYTNKAVLIGMVATYLPLMILPLYVALDRIEDSLVHAASDLGANGRRTMLRVVLPLARPGIASGCLLVGVPAMGEYVIPSILSGGKTLMLGNVIGDQFLTTGDYPFGSALASSFMLALTVFLVVGRMRGQGQENAL